MSGVRNARHGSIRLTAPVRRQTAMASARISFAADSLVPAEVTH